MQKPFYMLLLDLIELQYCLSGATLLLKVLFRLSSSSPKYNSSSSIPTFKPARKSVLGLLNFQNRNDTPSLRKKSVEGFVAVRYVAGVVPVEYVA